LLGVTANSLCRPPTRNGRNLGDSCAQYERRLKAWQSAKHL